MKINTYDWGKILLIIFTVTIPLKEDLNSKVLILLALAFVVVFLKKPLQKFSLLFSKTSSSYIFISSLVFLTIGVLSLIISGPTELFKGNRFSFPVLFVLFSLFFYVKPQKLFTIKAATYSLFIALSISGLVRFFYGIYQYFTTSTSFFLTRLSPIPLERYISSNPIIYGTLLNFCYSSILILFLKKEIKKEYFFIASLLLLTFHVNYFSLSSAIIFVLINIICLLFFYFKTLYKPLTICVFLFSVLSFTFLLTSKGGEVLASIEGEASRVRNYSTSLEIVKDSPLLGYGVGNELHILQSYRDSNSWEYINKYHAHNQYFETLLGGGIFYFMSFLSIIILSLIHAFNEKKILLVLFLINLGLTMYIESLLVIHKGFIFASFIWAYLIFNNVNEKDHRACSKERAGI